MKRPFHVLAFGLFFITNIILNAYKIEIDNIMPFSRSFVGITILLLFLYIIKPHYACEVPKS